MYRSDSLKSVCPVLNFANIWSLSLHCPVLSRTLITRSFVRELVYPLCLPFESGCFSFESRCFSFESGCFSFQSGCFSFESGCFSFESRCFSFQSGCFSFESGCFCFESGCFSFQSGCFSFQSGCFSFQSGCFFVSVLLKSTESPQKPSGLLGTESLGRPPRLSHTAPEL